MSLIDWPGLMKVGLKGLGLAPDVFWRLSPVELRTMLGDGSTQGPLMRTRLDELSRAFPDVKRETENG